MAGRELREYFELTIRTDLQRWNNRTIFSLGRLKKLQAARLRTSLVGAIHFLQSRGGDDTLAYCLAGACTG